MIDYLTYDLIIHLIIFQGIILVIILWNMRLTRLIRKDPLPDLPPSVSILVPARDEEDNIRACIESLLVQEYPDYEVLALDDQSTDQTSDILHEIAHQHPRLKILDGQPNPAGHPGKNWACTQLARQARGDILFFTDADTVHEPLTLATAVAGMEANKADLLTGYPRQIVKTWGERLLVPFFSWIILAFFPLGLAYRLKSPIFTNAVGQMILIKSDVYRSIGGHEAVNSSIVDDLSLARRIHQSGYRWRVIHAADLITCRMYRTSRQALEGFSKNLFAAFEFRLLPFLFSFAWLGLMFLEPLVLAFLIGIGISLQTPLWILVLCIFLSLLIWLISYWNLGLPLWLALIYPATVLTNGFTALRSLWLSLTGNLVWKGRTIQASSWKWL
jgi:chlorobactene glucosyltransferase